MIGNYLVEGKDNGCKAKARCGVGSQVGHVWSFWLANALGVGGKETVQKRGVTSSAV